MNSRFRTMPGQHFRMTQFELIKRGIACAAALVLGVLLLVPNPFALLGLGGSGNGPDVDSLVPDKAQHAIAYAILAGILLFTFSGSRRRVSTWAACVAFTHGAATELLQNFIPDRCPDLMDVLANGVGIACAVLGWNLFVSLAGTRPAQAYNLPQI